MTTLFNPTYSASSAAISPCGLYRYHLTRTWGDAKPAAFIMLNPSTADASTDDPTIRRCIGFARAWGCGGVEVVNLFAYRATNPADLATAANPIGPGNDSYIREVASRCSPVVAAWGAHVPARGRGNYVWCVLKDAGVELKCLGFTKNGLPRHPLYVPAKANLVSFAGAVT